jgi:hypothetical protein
LRAPRLNPWLRAYDGPVKKAAYEMGGRARSFLVTREDAVAIARKILEEADDPLKGLNWFVDSVADALQAAMPTAS